MIDLLVDEGVDTFASDGTSRHRIEEAVRTACATAGMTIDDPELCIRFASDQTVRELNRQWRDKDRVTDVLSFPMQDAPIDPAEPLGDIALAMPFVARQAAELKLDIHAHTLHLIIHATLHLLGYDHIRADEAIAMQRLEVIAMQRLGLHHPYPDQAALNAVQ